MCQRIRFSAIAYLQKAPIITSSENVPDSQSSAYRENIIFYSNKAFRVQYSKNIHKLIFIYH